MVFNRPPKDDKEASSESERTPSAPSAKTMEIKHLENRNKQFDKACAASREVFAKKNAQYDDSIRFTGVLGAVVSLYGAACRLPIMVLRAKGHGRSVKDALREVLKDIHNYANIALIMISEENWEGE